MHLKQILLTLLCSAMCLFAGDITNTVVIPMPPANGVGLTAIMNMQPVFVSQSNQVTHVVTKSVSNYVLQVKIQYFPKATVAGQPVLVKPYTVTYTEGQNLDADTVALIKRLWQSKCMTWETDMGFSH